MAALTAEDYGVVVEDFNQTDDNTTLGHVLHRVLEQAADRHTDKTAVACAGTELTYGRLHALANRLARVLVQRGTKRGDLVGVALDRSVDLIVVLLAVLKAGAAYVPIDPAFPAERISYMLQDAAPKLVVASANTLHALASWGHGGVCVDIDKEQGQMGLDMEGSSSDEDEIAEIGPLVNSQPEDLAYVIYTSGSTGRPKGVEISHGALCNLLLSVLHKQPGCGVADRLLAVTTVSFDIAALELWMPLLCGATTVVAQRHQVTDARALLALMQREAITMMQATPTTWQMLLDSGWRGTPRLGKILCGGEALPRRVADGLLACHADSVWNMYGPTEATVWASTWRVSPGDDVVIGRPLGNYRLYVLDEEKKPVAPGVTGELYIGGASLACGYRNNLDLTMSRFIRNPFHGGLMYRTGDLARFAEEDPGKLTVLGRTDSQVKIRGHRIELGDIEAAISEHDHVSMAVVVAREERLVAYCIRETHPIAGSGSDPDETRGVVEWTGAWDHVYGASAGDVSAKDDASATPDGSQDGVFNLAGWHSSYDGQPIPAGEMRDWQMSSVRRVLSCSPQRVVEVGSGTGLMLFSIAPHCSLYHAFDTSPQAVEMTRRQASKLALGHVVCERGEAHALPKAGLEGAFDTVIINSVAQYFPSIDYLVTVLEWSVKAVDNGRIYLGDVRNLGLLHEFHGDLIDFRTKGQVDPRELARRASDAAKSDRELLVSPEFFANLPTLFPQITSVDITLRDGRYDNEMTRYRFDVILHINEDGQNRTPSSVTELNWNDSRLGLNVASLRERLAVTEGNVLRLNNIPNGRLRHIHDRLAAARGNTSPHSSSSWVNPQVLKDVAAEWGRELALLPSRSGDVWSLDAVFWGECDIPDLRLHLPKVMDRDNLAQYANVPLVGEPAKPALSRSLRPWLEERLPAYMVPAFFVELEEFPQTLNGKIDRKALPDPTTVSGNEPAAKPATELERDILAIWSEVLIHDRISTTDNFFQIGGDSLRVVRVQAALEKLLGRTLSPAKLFEHYTIKALAAYLANVDKPNSSGPLPVPGLQRPNNMDQDIAIVSMACHLPGGVTTPDEYWDLLHNGIDAVIDVPSDRWNADKLYDADPDASGKSYCRKGGFITSSPIDAYDAAFFGISPREARTLDPSQYLMLETCWEAFERAGYTMQQLRGSQTGAFIGVSSITAYQADVNTRGLDDMDGYAVTGTSGGAMSGRVSYILGLEGPTLTVDTACSSSLVSTHLACSALRNGECDMAIAGGVSLLTTPRVHVEFSRLRGMAPDGRCRAFSADACGTGWGEGSAAVLLKRLSDARRDGDEVLAVVRGTAVNHGGRSASMTTPSGGSQERLIRTALAASALQPGDVDYVEAHGTGTRLGDPIEGAALAGVFGGASRRGLPDPGMPEVPEDPPLWVGSVKSNIGHTQATAGLAGLLKVVLAMQHRVIPRTLHITEATPAVDWAGANMAPVTERRAWPSRAADLPRRAGVSAFGIGGTNAHIVVEEAPRESSRQIVGASTLSHPLPFLVSAGTDAALVQQAVKLRRRISSGHDSLDDVAYSLATARNHLRKRLVVMASDKEELLSKLDKLIAGTNSPSTPPPIGDRRLAMMFTGQGSQHAGMGKQLWRDYPVFREAIEAIAAQFEGVLERPLLDVMWAEPGSEAASLLQRTDFAQPALFSLQASLWRLWQSWGVQPDMVLGHSVGEIAAAFVAGIFSLSDACRLVAARGRLMQALPMPDGRKGGMVSLEANEDDVAGAIETLRLGGKVGISGLNTPMQTVASGDGDAVEALAAHFKSQGRRAKKLDVSHAFHSHHMDGMVAAFETVAATVQYNPPTTPVFSSLTGLLAEAGQLEHPGYWVQQARRAVRFSDAVRTLAHAGASVFVELGPRPVLCGMGAECLDADVDLDKTHAISWLPSLVPGKDAATVIQGSLADLHKRHVSIDWNGYFKPLGCRRVALPTYAFQRDRFGRPIHESNDMFPKPVDAPVKSIDSLQFAVEWPPVDTHHVPPGSSWGLICTGGPDQAVTAWVEEARTALSQAGVQLIPVGQLEDAEHLDGVLCVWDSDADVLIQTRQFTAEALAQLQTAARDGFAAPVVWVTRCAVGTGSGPTSGSDDLPETTGLGAGPLWGLMRTARNEHPELRLRVIDVGAGQECVQALGPALMLHGEPECAVRQGQVLVPRMQRIDVSELRAEPEAVMIPRPDGAVLITGGLGDLGRRVAKWLAESHGVRDLVLTSRRGMEASGATALVDELSQLGCKATVVAGDMANVESVQEILSMFHHEERPLRGIVHTAGVLDDGVLSAMTPERCNVVYEPKIDGAWNLHQQTQHMTSLDFFVLFSSISGIMGTPGQANYAGANTFLDALAYLRKAQGLPATSVAWGLWGGDGMAAGMTGTGRRHLARLGHDALVPDLGLELLERAVRRGRALSVSAALNLDQVRGYFHERDGQVPPLLIPLVGETSSREEQNSSERGSDHTPTWSTPGDLTKALSEAASREHASIVLDMVRQIVARTLGFESPEGVDIDLPLPEIGIDSLTAILMRNRLASATGLTLSAGIALHNPNLRAMSLSLLSQIQDSWTDSDSSGIETGSGGATPVTSATAASSVGSSPRLSMSLIRKGCLDPNFSFRSASRTTRPESVLVTGATGFVGAFIVHDLLKLGIHVHCLVRAHNTDQAHERMVGTLASYGLWKPDEYTPLLNTVVGDITRPLLGLPDDVFYNLADSVDAICHSGALVDWMRPMEDYVGPNMVSTHEVLRLASYGRPKAVHLVSTVSALPIHMGYDLTEADREYGYGTSKYLAERMVSAARWRGLTASIYRLPFVTAAVSTGHFRLDRGDFLHSLVSGSLEMGAFPSLDATLSSVLPIDYLSSTIVAIMTQDQGRIGQDFDFVNERAPSFDRFFALLGEAYGGGEQHDILPFTAWQERALDYAVVHPGSPIARITAVVDGFRDETAGEMVTCKGSSGGQHVLGGDDYPSPPVDEESVGKYLARIRAGWEKTGSA
ncbi:putative PKS/NRPS-like protein biosynthetic cluster [Amphichorda felina]